MSPVTVDSLLCHPFRDRPAEEQSSILQEGCPKILEGPLRAQLLGAKIAWLVYCPLRQKLFCFPCLLYACSTEADGMLPEKLSFFVANHPKTAGHRTAETTWLNTYHRLFASARLTTTITQAKATASSSCTSSLSSSTPVEVDPCPLADRDFYVFRQILDRVFDVISKGTGTRSIKYPAHLVKRGGAMRDVVNPSTWFIDKLDCHDWIRLMQLQDVSILRRQTLLYRDTMASIVGIIKRAIYDEVGNAQYVTMILEDYSRDPSECHLAATLRYVPQHSGTFVERFLGFLELPEELRTADGLLDHLDTLADLYGVEDKLVGVVVDGFAIDNVELTKFVHMVAVKYPKVIVTHGHRLDAFLSYRLYHEQYASSIFFHRLGLMAHFIASRDFGDPAEKVLREVWPNRRLVMPPNRVVAAIERARPLLIAYFRQYPLLPRHMAEPPEAVARDLDEARECLHFLRDFTCILLTEFFEALLLQSVNLESAIRRNIHNWSSCVTIIENYLSGLRKFKEENFDKLWTRALGKYRQVRQMFLTSGLGGVYHDDDGDEDHFALGVPRENDAQSKQHYSELLDGLVESTRYVFNQFRLGPMTKLQFVALMAKRVQYYRRSGHFPEKSLEALVSTFPGLFDVARLREELSLLYADGPPIVKPAQNILDWLLGSCLDQSFCQSIRLIRLMLAFPHQLLAECGTGGGGGRDPVAKEYNTEEHFHVRLENEGYLFITAKLFEQLVNTGLDFQRNVWRHFNALRNWPTWYPEDYGRGGSNSNDLNSNSTDVGSQASTLCDLQNSNENALNRMEVDAKDLNSKLLDSSDSIVNEVDSKDSNQMEVDAKDSNSKLLDSSDSIVNELDSRGSNQMEVDAKDSNSKLLDSSDSIVNEFGAKDSNSRLLDSRDSILNELDAKDSNSKLLDSIVNELDLKDFNQMEVDAKDSNSKLLNSKVSNQMGVDAKEANSKLLDSSDSIVNELDAKDSNQMELDSNSRKLDSSDSIMQKLHPKDSDLIVDANSNDLALQDLNLKKKKKKLDSNDSSMKELDPKEPSLSKEDMAPQDSISKELHLKNSTCSQGIATKSAMFARSESGNAQFKHLPLKSSILLKYLDSKKNSNSDQ